MSSSKKVAPKKPAAKKRAARTPAPKKALSKKKKTAAKRKPNAAFKKAMQPGASLSTSIGGNAMPRSEATKKIWAYMKNRNAGSGNTKRTVLPATVEPRHLTHAQIALMVKSVRKP